MTRRSQHTPAGPTLDRSSHGSSTGSPLRIAVDGRFLTDRYPGIGRYLWNLLSPLSRLAAPEPVSVLTDRRSRNTRFDLEELRRQGLRLTATDVPARHPGEQIVVPRWARSVRAQVLHVPFWWTARLCPCPLVVTIHDAIPLEVPQTLPAVERWLYRCAARATARRAGRVLTLSHDAREQLARHLSIPRQRIDVTPAAADPRFAPATADAVSALRHRLGLPEVYALCLTGPRTHKNLPRLLRAWQTLDGLPGTPLLILAGLERRDDSVGHELPAGVRALGPIVEADLPVLLSGARLLVAPSLAEGFGLPLVEAMACATPVACSAIPVFTEVADDAAIFFDPLQPASIAAAVTRLLTDRGLREQLSRQGLQRARSYSWEETARQTLDGYRRALSP